MSLSRIFFTHCKKELKDLMRFWSLLRIIIPIPLFTLYIFAKIRLQEEYSYLKKDTYEKYPKANNHIKNNQEEASATAGQDTPIAQK